MTSEEIAPNYPSDFSQVAKAIELETGWKQFETAKGNALAWEVPGTRWYWLYVYRFEAGESPEMFSYRVVPTSDENFKDWLKNKL